MHPKAVWSHSQLVADKLGGGGIAARKPKCGEKRGTDLKEDEVNKKLWVCRDEPRKEASSCIRGRK